MFFKREVLMVTKRSCIIFCLSFLLVVSYPALAAAKSSKRVSSKSSSGSPANEKEKKDAERSVEKSPLAQGLDSVFIKMKADLDEVAGSSLLHAKATPPVTNLFLKTLKAHQPFYSLTRVNKTG